MKQIAFLVLVLVAVAFGQIPLYTGPTNSHGIYGPYGTYGSFGRNGLYGRIGTGPYGPVGNFGQGINPSIYHIGNSFFSKIQRRVETAYISPAQIPNANAILSDAVNNFKICENEYMAVPIIQTYKSCLQTFVNKAFEDVSILEGANQPTNFYDRTFHPYSNSKSLDDVETRERPNLNSIKGSMEIEV